MTSEPPSIAACPEFRRGDAEKRWLLAGYLFIAVFFVTRLAYLAAGRIELSEDEAYQWIWSKHPALSYFSKPPLIAYVQWLGTHLWGDTVFGIRFFSPVLATLLSLALLRFVAARVNARVGFWLVLILAATPILAVGSTLLTVDSPSVCFWVAAMLTGWRALETEHLRDWCWTGVFIGLGLLSKYTAVVQLVSWGVFFALYPPARKHLRRPGPYVAVAIALLAFVPVLVWNQQHGWITLHHLYDRGGLSEPWRFRSRYFTEFLLSEFGLLNPVFFVAMVWASVALWFSSKREPLLLYVFCMGATLFIFYLLYTVRGRVLPNWIAPSVVPLLVLMVMYWEQRWQAGCRQVKWWLASGLALGFLAVGLLHATELLGLAIGRPLPAKLDPLHRVRSWSNIAQMIEHEREQELAEGKPVFLIAQHYGLTSILTWYIPEAKTNVCREPLVYYMRTEHPENQFYFWPGYQERKGQNAIYVEETDEPTPPPRSLTNDFESVTDLGMRKAYYHGQAFRRYQLYLCRNLKGL